MEYFIRCKLSFSHRVIHILSEAMFSAGMRVLLLCTTFLITTSMEFVQTQRCKSQGPAAVNPCEACACYHAFDIKHKAAFHPDYHRFDTHFSCAASTACHDIQMKHEKNTDPKKPEYEDCGNIAFPMLDQPRFMNCICSNPEYNPSQDCKKESCTKMWQENTKNLYGCGAGSLCVYGETIIGSSRKDGYAEQKYRRDLRTSCEDKFGKCWSCFNSPIWKLADKQLAASKVGCALDEEEIPKIDICKHLTDEFKKPFNLGIWLADTQRVYA